MPISSIQSNTTNWLTQLTTASKKAATLSYDPADTNQDGVVSPAELLAYELSHPTARETQSAPSYTQKGGLQASLGNSLFSINA